MIYDMSKTLSFLPYLSEGLLLLIFVLLEVRNFRDQLTESPEATPGRGGFVPPPGDGYEYYVSANSIVYILRKGRNRFRIYVIQGPNPGTTLRHDRYGIYFTARSRDTGTAEKIVDGAYGV